MNIKRFQKSNFLYNKQLFISKTNFLEIKNIFTSSQRFEIKIKINL